MDKVRRYLNIAYIITGLILAWLGARTMELVFGAVAPTSDAILFGGFRLSGVIGALVGLGLTYAIRKNTKAHTFAHESTLELSRVTWPKMDETKELTVVVVVFAIIVSGFIAVCDALWNEITTAILTT